VGRRSTGFGQEQAHLLFVPNRSGAPGDARRSDMCTWVRGQ
jgi:hypothetical protein